MSNIDTKAIYVQEALYVQKELLNLRQREILLQRRINYAAIMVAVLAAVFIGYQQADIMPIEWLFSLFEDQKLQIVEWYYDTFHTSVVGHLGPRVMRFDVRDISELVIGWIVITYVTKILNNLLWKLLCLSFILLKYTFYTSVMCVKGIYVGYKYVRKYFTRLHTYAFRNVATKSFYDYLNTEAATSNLGDVVEVAPRCSISVDYNGRRYGNAVLCKSNVFPKKILLVAPRHVIPPEFVTDPSKHKKFMFRKIGDDRGIMVDTSELTLVFTGPMMRMDVIIYDVTKMNIPSKLSCGLATIPIGSGIGGGRSIVLYKEFVTTEENFRIVKIKADITASIPVNGKSGFYHLHDSNTQPGDSGAGMYRMNTEYHSRPELLAIHVGNAGTRGNTCIYLPSLMMFITKMKLRLSQESFTDADIYNYEFMEKGVRVRFKRWLKEMADYLWEDEDFYLADDADNQYELWLEEMEQMDEMLENRYSHRGECKPIESKIIKPLPALPLKSQDITRECKFRVNRRPINVKYHNGVTLEDKGEGDAPAPSGTTKEYPCNKQNILPSFSKQMEERYKDDEINCMLPAEGKYCDPPSGPIAEKQTMDATFERLKKATPLSEENARKVKFSDVYLRSMETGDILTHSFTFKVNAMTSKLKEFDLFTEKADTLKREKVDIILRDEGLVLCLMQLSDIHELIKQINLKSSPGFPYDAAFDNNAKLLENEYEIVVEHFLVRLIAFLWYQFHRTEIDITSMYEENFFTPVQQKIKKEPHAPKKQAEKRWRLYFPVSIAAQLFQRFIVRDYGELMLKSDPLFGYMTGVGLDPEGTRETIAAVTHPIGKYRSLIRDREHSESMQEEPYTNSYAQGDDCVDKIYNSDKPSELTLISSDFSSFDWFGNYWLAVLSHATFLAAQTFMSPQLEEAIDDDISIIKFAEDNHSIALYAFSYMTLEIYHKYVVSKSGLVFYYPAGRVKPSGVYETSYGNTRERKFISAMYFQRIYDKCEFDLEKIKCKNVIKVMRKTCDEMGMVFKEASMIASITDSGNEIKIKHKRPLIPIDYEKVPPRQRLFDFCSSVFCVDLMRYPVNPLKSLYRYMSKDSVFYHDQRLGLGVNFYSSPHLMQVVENEHKRKHSRFLESRSGEVPENNSNDQKKKPKHASKEADQSGTSPRDQKEC